MMDLKEQFITGRGWSLIKNIIPGSLLDDVTNRLIDIYPVRASSSSKQYAEKEDIKKLPDVCVWWSQTVKDWPEVLEIEKILGSVIKSEFTNLDYYSSDIVVIESGSTWVNPHVDTPHRFNKWNYDNRLLGVQCIIPLGDVNISDGATGVVSYSQKRDFNIHKCYAGSFDKWFLDNMTQSDLPKGSVLAYNCRVLHSSMPNTSAAKRPVLTINYLDKDITDEIIAIDNIWTSNGKRP